MKVKGKSFSLVVGAGFAAFLLASAPALAVVAQAPSLGIAKQFGALGNSAVTGSAAPGTVVNGDVGSGPTSPTISNFPPSSTTPPFIVHTTVDGVVSQAHTDANAAYTFLAGQGGSALPGGTPDQLSGRTLGPGVYSLGAGDLAASTNLTLNDPTGTGIFVFNVASSLTMNGSSTVTGTANPCNVYWRVGSSAALNGLSFMGTIIADTSITVSSASNVSGSLLAGAVTTTGVVTMSVGGNTIGGCSTLLTAPVVVPPEPGGVALSKAFFPTTALSPGGDALLTITLSNNNTTPSSLTSNLVDTLPSGLTIVGGSLSTTCGGTAPSAGASSVTLPIGLAIPGATPPPGFCTVIVHVTSVAGGSFSNTLPAGALCIAAIGGGNICNSAAAVASLGGAPIPTLSEWAMIMLAALLVLFGVAGIRRHAM